MHQIMVKPQTQKSMTQAPGDQSQIYNQVIKPSNSGPGTKSNTQLQTLRIGQQWIETNKNQHILNEETMKGELISQMEKRKRSSNSRNPYQIAAMTGSTHNIKGSVGKKHQNSFSHINPSMEAKKNEPNLEKLYQFKKRNIQQKGKPMEKTQ